METESIEENDGLVNTIMLMRIYDVLLAIYDHLAPAKSTDLVKLHEQGIFISPPPAWRVDND